MSNDTRRKATAVDEEDLSAILQHESEVATLEPTASEDRRKPSMARRTKLLISIGIVAAAIVGGYFIRTAFLYEDTDDAQIDGHVMPISARINGQVLEVHVIEGQLVHTGDVLVVIDPKDYKIATEQAKANLADARASAASSMWGVPVASATAWSTLDSSKAAIQNAEAGVKAAERNLESAKAAQYRLKSTQKKPTPTFSAPRNLSRRKTFRGNSMTTP